MPPRRSVVVPATFASRVEVREHPAPGMKYLEAKLPLPSMMAIDLLRELTKFQQEHPALYYPQHAGAQVLENPGDTQGVGHPALPAATNSLACRPFSMCIRSRHSSE